MRRSQTLFLLVAILIIATSVCALAAQGGYSCTKKIGTDIVNPECGVNGSKTSVQYWSHYECEPCSHRSKCDDEQLFIQQETVRYSGKGADPCANITYRECIQIYACNGHPLPGNPSDWTVNPPP